MPTEWTWLETLRRHRPRILVVGDVMVDGYWFGDARRISPEAPVPVVAIGREEYRPGGAAHVAVILQTLGAEVFLVGGVGRDEEARILRGRLREMGVSDEFLVVLDRPTTRKVRVVVRNQQLARLDWEDGSPLREEEFRALRHRVEALAREVDAVVFQDYGKGVFTPSRIPDLIRRVRDVPLLVDPKPRHMDAYRGVTLLKPNRQEYLDWGRHALHPGGLFRARDALGVDVLLVTLGEEGMVVVEKDQQTWIPSTRHEVYDVTGAGDAVLAGVAFARSSGLPWVACARFATLVAGREVMHLGTAPVSWDEVEEEARKHLDRLVAESRRITRGS